MGIMKSFFVFGLIILSISIELFAEEVIDPINKKKIQCAIKLSDLDYVGQKFTGNSRCVFARNDIQATLACRGQRFINPANPQYTDNGPWGPQSGKIKDEHRTSNPDGYYYCVEKQNDKQVLCENAKSVPGHENLTFRFERNPGQKDGNCYCDVAGKRPKTDCARPSATAAAAQESKATCEKFGFKADDRPNTEKDTAAQMFLNCRCPQEDKKDVYFVQLLDEQADKFQQFNKENCAKKKDDPAAAAAPAATEPAKPPVATSALNQCIAKWKALADKCAESSGKVKTACKDINKSNQGLNTAAKVADGAGGIYSTLNQGSGMQQECFKAGILASGVALGLRQAKDDCLPEQRACFTACGEARLEEYKKTCAKEAGSTVEELSNGANQSEDAKAYRAAFISLEDDLKYGLKNCGKDPDEKNSWLSSVNDALNTLGTNMQNAAICACKTSSTQKATPDGSCESIPSPEFCAQVPQPAGCAAYGTFQVCTPGSMGYDAKTCSCMQNPSGGDCTGTGFSNQNAFAGPGTQLNNGGGGPSAFAGGAGGPKSTTNFDSIATGGDDGGERSLLTLGAARPGGTGGSPGGTGGGPGGTGGGNGPLGDQENTDGGPAEQNEKGVGGLFNQAKTFLTGALGMGKGANKNNGRGNGNANGNGFDSNRFKPKHMRGLATVDDCQPGQDNSRKKCVASRNADIWKLMNMCTSGESCKSNVNNYLTGP